MRVWWMHNFKQQNDIGPLRHFVFQRLRVLRMGCKYEMLTRMNGDMAGARSRSVPRVVVDHMTWTHSKGRG